MTPRTILVPYDGRPRADDMLRLACDVVPTVGGRVVAFAVTHVVRSLPLAGLPASIDRAGRDALTRARDLARHHGREIETHLMRSYDIAPAIIWEARDIQADAIFLAVERPRLSWLPLLLPGTARTVIRRAPCPVILGYFPAARAPKASEVLAEAERLLSQAS